MYFRGVNLLNQTTFILTFAVVFDEEATLYSDDLISSKD